MDKKRIIGIIIFIVFIVVFGYIIYRIFFRSPNQTGDTTGINGSISGQFPGSQNGNGTLGGLPTSGNLPVSDTATPSEDFFVPSDFPTVREITLDPVKGTTVGANGGVKYYNQTDGKFYGVDSFGNAKLLTEEVFYNVQNVVWSPTKNESNIEYPDGANIYYNFDTKKQVTLPKHWENFSFSENVEKIAAKSVALSAENRWLVVSNPDGTDVQLVEALGNNADKVTVDWSPNNQVVALAQTGEALGANRQDIHLVGINGENFSPLTVEGRGFESIWSPEGKKILYSVYNSRNNFNPELWIANAEGTTAGTGRKSLGLSTWAQKCAFQSERILYCAVPSDLQRGTGFAPDLANNTQDVFYRIDIESGSRTQLTVDAFHVVQSMFLGDDGKNIYFTDKVQPGLYSLPL